MNRRLIVLLALAAVLVLAACAPAAPTPAAEAPVPEMATESPSEETMADGAMMDIVDTAVGAGGFTTLVAAVEAAGLVDTLKGEGPFTVFAPTDEAFAALPEGTVDTLLADPTGDLTQILLYHVLSGKVMAADVTDGLTADTVQGSPVSFTVADDGSVMIGDATIVTTDIETSNGVIHVIDAVLLPPNDEAMGETDMTSTEEMTATEGMTATEAMTDTDVMEEPMADANMMDIVDTAVGAGSFTTLVAAVEAAGLVDTLKGEGPFTVFAPTDEAFAALPEGTVDTLLADPTGDLTQILLYHVLSGKVMAADVTDGLTADTVQGSPVSFTVADDGSVMIGDATIVATDIETSNGVIHVIDAVLLPPSN